MSETHAVIHFSQILPELYVGSHPRSAVDLERLVGSLGTTAVLNLQTDRDLDDWNIDWTRLEKSYRHHSVVLRRVPIVDFDREDLCERLSQAVDTLDEMLRGGHRVYLHCTAGAERAPSTAIAYLTWCRGWSLQQATSHVERVRDCAPGIDAIVRAAEERARRQAQR